MLNAASVESGGPQRDGSDPRQGAGADPGRLIAVPMEPLGTLLVHLVRAGLAAGRQTRTALEFEVASAARAAEEGGHELLAVFRSAMATLAAGTLAEGSKRPRA